MTKELEVPLKETGISAFVRIKDKDAQSITFEIRFSEPILESVLDTLAGETFGSGYSTSERYFIIRFVGFTHEQCCPILDKFLKEFDKRLAEIIVPWTHAFQETLIKG